VCCSVLQCVAVCCSVLQCVAVCCSVLQCVAVCCSVLHCVIYPQKPPNPETTWVFSMWHNVHQIQKPKKKSLHTQKKIWTPKKPPNTETTWVFSMSHNVYFMPNNATSCIFDIVYNIQCTCYTTPNLIISHSVTQCSVMHKHLMCILSPVMPHHVCFTQCISYNVYIKHP